MFKSLSELLTTQKVIFSIPVEENEKFKQLLISYYEGKEEKKIKEFIKEKCYIKI